MWEMKDASVGMTKEGEIGVLDEFHSFRDSLRLHRNVNAANGCGSSLGLIMRLL